MRHVAAILFILGALLGVSVGFLPSPWFVLSPGGSYEIGPRLRVPDERRQEMGRLAFTAVYAQEANLAQALGARLSRTSELVPAEQVRPPGVSQQEVNENNRRLIDESKPVAAAVALRAAGYEVEITGKGAEVNGTVEGMPAHGVLQKGDLIVKVDNQPVLTTTELIESIRRRELGSAVRLVLVRGGERQEVVLETRSSATDPGRPAVGAYISTLDFNVALPFPVEIESESVGGPSAGLMFALGVLDVVTEGVLTRGHFVAGTGSINVDGSVGAVGGTGEKVLSAEREGAAVFLVPVPNVEEAQKRARKTRVIGVATFDEAVRALCSLDPAPDASTTPPGPCTRYAAG